jgi:hypothetical protein
VDLHTVTTMPAPEYIALATSEFEAQDAASPSHHHPYASPLFAVLELTDTVTYGIPVHFKFSDPFLVIRISIYPLSSSS